MDAEAAPPAPQGPTNVLSLHVPEFTRKREEFAVFLCCLEMEFVVNPLKYRFHTEQDDKGLHCGVGYASLCTHTCHPPQPGQLGHILNPTL